jgi:SWI/SNF-related matrix-associated actin-dependent regulator of chromatin subfamily A-like protein 1
MELHLTKDVYWATASYDERLALKEAGFFWHGGQCQPQCAGCAAGLGKVWFTPFIERAQLLQQFGDAAVRALFQARVTSVQQSRALTSEGDFPAPAGLSYYGFQKAGIAYALARPATLLGDEMGIGKTIQALGLINADPSLQRVLVVCPANLRINWQREAQKWLVRPTTIVIAEDATEIPVASAGPAVIIVNYERLIVRKREPKEPKPGAAPTPPKGPEPSERLLRALMADHFDLLVADEAHFLKNPKSSRTKSLLGVVERPKKQIAGQPGLETRARRRLFLTGTPILNRPAEIQPLLAVLNPAEFGNFFKFALRYCGAVEGKFGWDFSGASNLGELQERMRATVLIRRRKADVLPELPPMQCQIIVLPPNGAAKAVAKEAAAWAPHETALTKLQLAVELAHASGNAVSYAAAAKALKRGKQVAFEAMAAVRQDLALAKVPQVIAHVQDMLAEGVTKVVVWCHHHSVARQLSAAFGAAAVTLTGETPEAERQLAVDRFQNDPAAQVGVMSIKAAGVGYTLTAAKHEVYAELDWTPSWMNQSAARCHRIGTVDNVLVQHLVFDGSLDARMAQLLVAKQRVADAALDDPLAADADEPLVPLAATVEAPPAVYPVAPTSQRQAVAAQLQALVARAGFTAADDERGRALAAKALDRPLTDGEVWLAERVLRHYPGAG